MERVRRTQVPSLRSALQPNVTVSRSSIHTSPITAGESFVEMLLRALPDSQNFFYEREKLREHTCGLSVEEYYNFAEFCKRALNCTAVAVH